MKIYIRGKSKKALGISHKELRYAVWWMATTLMGPRMSKNLTFHVNMKVDHDYCFPLDTAFDDDSRKTPREFEIGLSFLYSRAKHIRVLAHEMVHAKQFVRGELRHMGMKTARWNGKIVPLGSSIEEYLEYPWEIEAYGRERGLYFLYQSYIMNKKMKFK